jgi:hypothetical protein
MIEKLLSAVKGFGSADEFEGVLSNLLVDKADGQTPTMEEARRQYRVMVNERAAFVGRFQTVTNTHRLFAGLSST